MATHKIMYGYIGKAIILDAITFKCVIQAVVQIFCEKGTGEHERCICLRWIIQSEERLS